MKIPNISRVLWIVGVIWFLAFLWLTLAFPNWVERSRFSNFFENVNSIFSGLTFIGLIYTIILQMQTIELQKKELKMQKDELILTRDEFKIQNETLKKQRFENTFFQLLTLHHEIVSKLEIRRPDISSPVGNFKSISHSGRDFFQEIKSDLIHAFGEAINPLHVLITNTDDNKELFLKNANKTEGKRMLGGYIVFHHDYQNQLSHYFRELYHIFKYIHVSLLITDDEKKFYISIVRSQLSQNELFFLFYNCMTKGLGREKFKFLVDKYDILQNFDKSELINVYHLSIFNKTKAKDPFLSAIA